MNKSVDNQSRRYKEGPSSLRQLPHAHPPWALITTLNLGEYTPVARFSQWQLVKFSLRRILRSNLPRAVQEWSLRLRSS